MYEVKSNTLKNALKPYDIVRLKDGEIALITEVSVNSCQETPEAQISYSIDFITDNINRSRSAWYSRAELEFMCNIFVKIAKNSTHPAGHSQQWVERLLINS